MSPTPQEIKALRSEFGLTQTQFAEIAGYKLRMEQFWESGEYKMNSGIWELYQIKLGKIKP